MQCVQVYCFLIFLFYLLAVIVYAFYLFDDFVLSYKTELLEIRSDDPKLHVLFIPGNPGVVSFYKDFLESLYELLGGTASVTGLFCIGQQLLDTYLTQKRTGSVEGCSHYNNKLITRSSIRSDLLSFSIASLGVLPRCISRIIVSNSIGKSWSATAVDAACSHLLQYHSFRNMIFMALTEFRKLSETPNWEFMRENQSKMAFLFGVDDHWGPLEMFEEIAKQVPGITLSIEREGHTHSFCCTEAGSSWVAQHVANLIKNQILGSC
ncbi:uncharacterized protein LOC105635839 isoform X6 [Jatropha curcas]|uniref:uncharacterized protein LOC105635839 isoform X6 n=1 Tax=Jatropha curcas TaxID=180498 RepID=UPI001895F561|nr:uncharacterized protein LOC105635839 isoform X6 [Jatropha curcas]